MSNEQQQNTTVTRIQPKRKVSVLAVIGLFFLITCGILVICVLIVAGIKSTEQTAEGQSSTNLAAKATIGQSFSEDGFSFTVNSIKCGETRITTGGDIYFYSDAQGQFCRLNVTVTNTGNNANSIDANAQYLFNSQGQRYTYDSAATSHAANYSIGNPLDDEINPGNSVTGDFVFDVPQDVNLVTAEIHADSGSRGVEVSLK